MTTDTVELYLANRVERLTPTERDEWARRAVKTFQGMEYLWTAFARVLTGNPAVRVVMSGGPSRTDGETIYYRPPLMLGDPSPHVRSQCDRRDTDGHLICPACSVRESVERSITHEVSHIVGGSFQKSTPEQQQRALRQAVAYAKNPIARAHLEAGLNRVQWGDDVQAMMFKMSPFLGLLIMALEDARIDMQMFKARPGVRKMFASSQKRFSTVGMVDLSGEVIQWSNRPLNAQMVIGLLWQAEGFDPGDLHDKVKHDLQDPVLQDVCLRVGRSGSALEIAALTVETLTRLWELGYCEPPEDMPEPPPYEPPQPPQPPAQDEEQDDKDESEPEEGSGDDSSDSGDSDDDAGDEESPEQDSGDSGSDESDPGSGPSSEGDGGTPAEDPPGQPDSDEAEDSSSGGEDLSEPGGDEQSDEPDGPQDSDTGQTGGGPEEGPGDQDSDDGGGSGDAGDAEPGSDDSDADAAGQEDGSDQGEGADRPAGGQPNGDSEPGDVGDGAPLDNGHPGEDERRSDDGGDGSESDESSVSDDGEGEPGSDSQEDYAPGARDDGSGGDDGGPLEADTPAGGEDDGESSSEGDRGDDGQGESGRIPPADGEPGDRSDQAEGDPGSESSSDDSGGAEPSDRPVGAGDPGSSAGDDRSGEESESVPDADETDGTQDPTPPVSGDGDAGAGEQVTEDLPEHGAAEDVAELIQDLTGHNHEDDEVIPGVEAADIGEQQAIDKAIVQNQHFDAPSATVSDLRVYTWPEDDKRCEAWSYSRAPAELTIRIGDKDSRGNDLWDTLRTPEEILQPALFEMKRILADNRRARDERNIKRGKLDGRSLGKRAWKGDDDRLYKKRTRPKDRSYAVIIAGDCSWSQHHGKTMVVTKQAMFAQAELCHRMGIQFEVWAHTAEITDQYRRTMEEDFDMVMNRIKSWTDPWNAQYQEGLAWLHAVETNLDGHNLEFLRKRLMQTTATDKILLYYTDGEMPAANYDDELDVFKRELELYKRLGIVIVGVGVGTDSPKRWGLPTVRIDKKGDIGKVIKHLEGEILHARR